VILEWYQKYGRPFLTKNEPTRVKEYDEDSQRLLALEDAIRAEVPICFLGNSGIGKSTLINALVAGEESLLPSGGIGPLTAQALSIRYGEKPSFKVEYHPPSRLNSLIFALDSIYRAELRKGGKEIKDLQASEIGMNLDPGDVKDLELEIDPNTEDYERRRQAYKAQALLLVAGRQDEDRELPYLIDKLCIAIGIKKKWGTDTLFPDDARITRLKEALSRGKNKQIYECSILDQQLFKEELHAHAAGHLAPLIRQMTVMWDSDLLKAGVSLVDLPGVGVASDINADVTRTFIREKAKAVILVVDTRGIYKETAELLYRSGFLNRLLFSFDDPTADPVALIVVVVRTDIIADERKANDKSKTKLQHFVDVCAESDQWIRSQLQIELENVWSRSDGLSEEKRGVIERIIENLEIHPLSAIQYRRFLSQDEDDPAFIKEAEDSRLPQLCKSLKNLAINFKNERAEHLRNAKSVFFYSLDNQLQLIKAQLQEDGASDVVEALRQEFKEFLNPLEKEFNNRQGAYREFLRSTVAVIISDLVTKAGNKATKDINKYLYDIRGAHWSTLRAAVRRGGAFSGARQINLPHDFALRFEEPVAEIWGKLLLMEIRQKTKDYADDCVRLVEQLVGWAREHQVRPRAKVLDAQTEIIKSDAQKLNSVGREAVNELREQIKNSLITKIEKPIRNKCQRFVQRGDDIGGGVKNRILQLFEELADDVIEAAIEPATDLLQSQFREVEREIITIFDRHKNPLASLSDIILSSGEERVRQGDMKVRAELLTELNLVIEVRPNMVV